MPTPPNEANVGDIAKSVIMPGDPLRAKYIAENAKELIIRVPVIPTFNATEGEIAQIAEFAASLPNVKKLHLLPYHRLGLDKYKGLGRKYELEHITPPSDEHMEKLKSVVLKYNLECQIGG